MVTLNQPFKIIDNQQKQLPCNIEAEQSVLGSILVSNEIYDEISQIVDEIGDGLKGIKSRYSNNLPSKITTLKGPNRQNKQTDSNIGSHDPKEIYLILLDD